jgi:hypothetical protein
MRDGRIRSASLTSRRSLVSEHSWESWKDHVVRRRGGVVHGRPVPDVNTAEALEVLDFVDRMATWYPQRFLTSQAHPIARTFRDLLRSMAAGDTDA